MTIPLPSEPRRRARPLVAHDIQGVKLGLGVARPGAPRARARLAGDPTLADDIVQDTIERALKFAEQYERGTNLRAWVYQILFSVFVTRYRRTRREKNALRALASDPLRVDLAGALRSARRFGAAHADHAGAARRAPQDVPRGVRRSSISTSSRTAKRRAARRAGGNGDEPPSPRSQAPRAQMVEPKRPERAPASLRVPGERGSTARPRTFAFDVRASGEDEEQIAEAIQVDDDLGPRAARRRWRGRHARRDGTPCARDAARPPARSRRGGRNL